MKESTVSECDFAEALFFILFEVAFIFITVRVYIHPKPLSLSFYKLPCIYTSVCIHCAARAAERPR